MATISALREMNTSDGDPMMKKKRKPQASLPDQVAHLESLVYSRAAAKKVMSDLLGGHQPRCPDCGVYLEVCEADFPGSAEDLVCARCEDTYASRQGMPEPRRG